MTPSQTTGLEAFLENAPQITEAQDANAPLTVFPTAMALPREQEDSLVKKVLDRKVTLARAMGRNESREVGWWRGFQFGQSGGIGDLDFLKKRELFSMVYHQQMDWRPAAMGGIYEKGQNVHMPFIRRIVQQMIARANTYFFGTEPYFSVNPMPAPDVDPLKAQQVDKFSKYKFRRAKLEENLRTAVQEVFICGECTIKTRHWTDMLRYEQFANVAVDGKGGAPLLANDQDYIYDTDRWVSRPLYTPEQQQAAKASQINGLDPSQMGVDMSQIPMVMTLERDPTTSLPDNLMFERRKVTRKITRYNGPQAQPCNRNDFLYPLDQPDLQLADCVMHIYDIPAIQLFDMYIERLKAAGQYDPKEFSRVLDALRNATVPTGGTSHAMASQPNPALGEAGVKPVDSRPMLSIAEAYIREDVNGDGQYEEVFIMIDLNTKRPIMYDHLPNVFPNARRPFHQLRINPPADRSHGIGMVEVLWELQRLIDLELNRWDFSISNEGSVTIFNAALTKEGAGNPHLKLNNGECYTAIDANTDLDKIVKRVWLYEYKAEKLQELVNFAGQMMTNMTGVTNVNDGEMVGLDTQKLATGIRSLDKSGQEQFEPFLDQLEPGITSVLEGMLYLTLWHMNEVEAYHVLEGGIQTPMEIQAVDVRNLQYEVDLELSKYKDEQNVAQSQAARNCLSQFNALPPQLQQIQKPLFEKEMKSYGIEDPDSLLVVGGGMIPQMPGQPQEQPSNVAQFPPQGQPDPTQQQPPNPAAGGMQ